MIYWCSRSTSGTVVIVAPQFIADLKKFQSRPNNPPVLIFSTSALGGMNRVAEQLRSSPTEYTADDKSTNVDLGIVCTT
jgi:hypothetical protein